MAWAEMLETAAPEIYGLIWVPRPQLLEILLDQLNLEGGEQENAYGLLIDGNPAGLITAIEASAWGSAKLVSAHRIASQLDDEAMQQFLEALVGHEQSVEPLDPSTIYLPRLAVHPSARRLGVGGKCMNYVIGLAPERAHSCHVHRDNAAIIALHSRLGFRFQSERDYAYRAMIR